MHAAEKKKGELIGIQKFHLCKQLQAYVCGYIHFGDFRIWSHFVDTCYNNAPLYTKIHEKNVSINKENTSWFLELLTRETVGF